MGKRSKGQDRDKYYRLAKDQGYRARSAFKLIEINKKYDFLSSAKVCIDLCAAPGGWCQVASKFMPRGSIVIGVDLLPIRPIPNVKTLVHDITTDECRTALKREMQTWKADVVLCDGAPNVGTAYKKDAYEQNEIALHALRVATQHLRKGGTFVTKVYRSQDYNSLLWVIQQFFTQHQAVKPASSRSQSAEIFVVGQNYKAPDFIDPRMLDPRHAFEQDYESTGGRKGLSVFHKKYDQHNKRQRQGYDEDLGMTLSRVVKVTDFVDAEDPVRVLSDAHVFEFGPECKVYHEHRGTNEEIKHLCSDLRILGKGDFRQLIKWRYRMVKYRDELQAHTAGPDGEEEDDEEDDTPKTEEEKEEDVQEEIKALQLEALSQRKRSRKKEREAAARLRARVAMGMESHTVNMPDEEGVFSLSIIKSGKALEAVHEVDLAEVEASEMEVQSDGSDGSAEEPLDSDDSEDYDASLEQEVNAGYLRFLQAKEDSERTEGTRLGKRKKKEKAIQATEEAKQDDILYDKEQQRYLQLLANGGLEEDPMDESDIDSSDVASDDSDEDVDADREVDEANKLRSSVPRSGGRGKRARTAISSSHSQDPSAPRSTEQHPLLKEIASKSERRQMATQRWFGDSLFADVDVAFEEGQVHLDGIPDGGTLMDTDGVQDARVYTGKGKKIADVKILRGAKEPNNEGGVAAEVLAAMPKTDKEKRREKRKKATERKERKELRNSKRMGEEGIPDNDLQIVSGEKEFDNLDPKERAKMEEKRKLIRAGMGDTADGPEDSGFEIAKANNAAMAVLGICKKPYSVDGLSIADEREYGSDQEHYDDEDRARQLALGTMMLRNHRAKELVDAAYNRFSWNDDTDLPDWFIDDEKRHYRPQVPLPPALLEQMKQKFMSLAAKPIKKVAEARLRKRKRATQRLAAAKKKASALAANPDMSEREKLKAVQQAMKKSGRSDLPSKVYVVAGKMPAGTRKGAKIKMVDKRMKSDTRGKQRAEEKRKMGKNGNRKSKGRQSRH